MRAVILTELNKDFEIRDDIELSGPGPGEVRVRMVASGLCHSDVSFQNGTAPVRLPSIVGHEGAGEIIAVGDGVDHVAVGDNVVISWVPPCGRCFFCLGHQPNLCMTGLIQAATTPHFKLGGEDVFSGVGTATFAEETVIPAIGAIKIPKEIPLDVAALVGCAVMTGVGAAINTAQVRPGSSVLVIGCGGVGVSAIMGARAAGAAEIVGVDTVDRKLDWAQQFGATHAAKPEGLEALKGELTEGRGFDYTFEVVGTKATIQSAWENTRRGGTVVVVGMTRPGQLVELDAYDIFFSEKKLMGSFYGSGDVRTDFLRWLRMWQRGQLDLEAMVTRRIDLGEVNDAVRAMLAGEVIRTVIEFK
jgi:S-(hydroxymethyl)glutathione dehydrogenase/alcohol dehydrogenase